MHWWDALEFIDPLPFVQQFLHLLVMGGMSLNRLMVSLDEQDSKVIASKVWRLVYWSSGVEWARCGDGMLWGRRSSSPMWQFSTSLLHLQCWSKSEADKQSGNYMLVRMCRTRVLHTAVLTRKHRFHMAACCTLLGEMRGRGSGSARWLQKWGIPAPWLPVGQICWRGQTLGPIDPSFPSFLADCMVSSVSWLLITATKVTDNLNLTDKSKFHSAESHWKRVALQALYEKCIVMSTNPDDDKHRAAGGERYLSIIWSRSTENFYIAYIESDRNYVLA